MKTFIIGLLISLPAWAGFVVPATPHPVNDYAGVLTVAGKEQAAKKIVELKTELGVQIGVLIVPTLDGTDITSAAEAVMSAWKLGSKERDDGILLMLSIGDRKSRIEVGRGLEGVLTDAQSKDILYSMRAFLKAEDYDGALNHGLSYIYTIVQNGKADIMAKPVAASSNTGFGIGVGILSVLSLIGIGVLVAGYRRQKRLDEIAAEEAKNERLSKANKDQSYLNLLAEIKQKRKSSGITGMAPVYTTPKKKTVPESHNTYVPIPIVIDTHSHSSDDSSSGFSSSSDSSFSDSSWSGGGGDFSGGGSSDSW